MATITGLDKDDKGSKITVQIDSELACVMPRKLVADVGLRVGMDIDQEWLTGLVHKENVRIAIQRAARLLEIRSRGSKEMARALKQRGFDESVIEEALARLTKLGTIDDAQFAAEFIASRGRAHPQAVRMTRSELAARGVAKGDIEDALTGMGEIDELALARVALAKRARSLPDDKEERRKAYQRLANFLAGRGFGWEITRKALAEHFTPVDAGDDE